MTLETLIRTYGKRATLAPNKADVKAGIGDRICTVFDIRSTAHGIVLIVGIDSEPDTLAVAADRVTFTN